ncbi:MAG TPA: pantoate--beta-alanine ligase [Nevskiaceae bacterium]
MQRVDDVAGLKAALGAIRTARVALVPTMGNLHAGHLALVNRARREAERVVVSIFVNPLQFGPHEDLASYPRSLEQDLAKLHEAGADVVFVPAVDAIYPHGYPPATRVRVTGTVAETLEGALRPGHFDGVATVVSILFNLVRPNVAVFGEKDWQQLQVVQRMVADLGSGVRVVGEPVVRAADGLALSSRNSYLSAAERRRAPRLHAALQAVASELRAGRRDFPAVCARQRDALIAEGFAPDYLEVRRPDLELPVGADRRFRILAAARLGRARLIDNVGIAIGAARG